MLTLYLIVSILIFVITAGQWHACVYSMFLNYHETAGNKHVCIQAYSSVSGASMVVNLCAQACILGCIFATLCTPLRLFTVWFLAGVIVLPKVSQFLNPLPSARCGALVRAFE